MTCESNDWYKKPAHTHTIYLRVVFISENGSWASASLWKEKRCLFFQRDTAASLRRTGYLWRWSAFCSMASVRFSAFALTRLSPAAPGLLHINLFAYRDRRNDFYSFLLPWCLEPSRLRIFPTFSFSFEENGVRGSGASFLSDSSVLPNAVLNNTRRLSTSNDVWRAWKSAVSTKGWKRFASQHRYQLIRLQTSVK